MSGHPVPTGPLTSRVDDPKDARLADYRRLHDPASRTRTEHDGGFFMVEGALGVERLCEAAVASRWQPRSLLVTPAQWARLGPAWTAAFPQAPCYLADQDVLRATVGFNLHRGVVAAVRRPAPTYPAEVLAGCALDRPVVVAEGLVDHENVGAVFRNAAGFGAGAVLADGTCADPLYRRSVRVSLGHVLAVPFVRGGAVTDLLAAARATGRPVLALTPAADESLWDLPMTEVGGAALLVGTEGPGLTPQALAGADRRVRIPMAGGVDSLNVATALAVALAACTRPG